MANQTPIGEEILTSEQIDFFKTRQREDFMQTFVDNVC